MRFPAVPAVVDGPVQILQTPAAVGAPRGLQVSTTPIRCANVNPRRRRLVLVADAAIIVASDPDMLSQGAGLQWPGGVPLYLTHREELYVRAVTGGTTVTQSLFSGAPVVGDAADGQPINTGTTLMFAVAGEVTHIRMYAPSTISGAYVGALYQCTSNVIGTLLASETFTGVVAGYNTVELSSPIAVTPGTVYRSVIRAADGHYVATLGALAAGLTVGDITAPAAGAAVPFGTTFNGVYDYGALTYPNENGSGAAYFADVVFVADGQSGSGPVNVTIIEESTWR